MYELNHTATTGSVCEIRTHNYTHTYTYTHVHTNAFTQTHACCFLQVPQGYTVAAALSGLSNDVHGCIKGGLYQLLWEADQASSLLDTLYARNTRIHTHAYTRKHTHTCTHTHTHTHTRTKRGKVDKRSALYVAP